VLRRYWPHFFDVKSAFYNTGNLATLMWRHDLVLTAHFPVPVTQTTSYFMDRIAPDVGKAIDGTPLRAIPARLRTGSHAAMFRRKPARVRAEKLSVVFPVYNEATYVGEVLEALLAKPLKIEKEVIVVESNSTDGTREIVQSFEKRPGVKVIYE